MSNWWDAAPLVNGLDARARDMAIRTIYGEAANEPDDGKAAVAAVIRNRVNAGNYGGKDVPSVVLAPNQFEPWNRPDARSRMAALKRDDPAYQGIGSIVDQVFSGQMPDPTGGATHFFAPEAQAKLGRPSPAWAAGAPVAAIGGHRFYAPDGGAKWWESAPLAGEAAPVVNVERADLPPPEQPGQFLPPTESLRERREGVAPAAREVGIVEAVGRGAAKGLTANWYDELRGLAEAGGTTPVEPLSLGAVLLGGYRKLTGDKDANKAYDAAVKREREATNEAEKQHPVASVAGEIGGAVAIPMGGLLKGATMTARVANSARVGLGYGAVSGAGEGDGAEDRAQRAAIGGATGAVVGAAAPPLLAGAEKIAGVVGNAVRPVVSGIRGARDVDAEASRRVVDALRRDVMAGSEGLSPAEFAAARAQGSPVGMVDLGGETTRALARSSANTSPEAKAALERLTSDRFSSQSDRASDFLRSIVTTPGNATVTRDALEQAAQTARKPFYDQAYRAGSQGIVNPQLVSLMDNSPIMATVAREAVDSIKNKAATGRAMNPLGPNGPTLQFWDQVRRSLDSRINVAKRQGDRESVADMTAIRERLLTELDAAVPEYAVARGVAASFFKANDALDAGEKFVTQNFKNADARKALAKMSPEERDLFAEGFASRYVETLNRIGDRRNILNQIANSPQAREKVEIALGPHRAKDLEAFLRVEGIMDKARGAVSGNSTTAAQLIAAGMAGGLGNMAIGGDFASGAGALAAARGGAKFLGQRIDRKVAQRVGEMLASNDPYVLRKGIQIVARNPKMMQALRDADNSIARIGAQQSPSLPVQLPGFGRAEDQQDIPRPERQ